MSINHSVSQPPNLEANTERIHWALNPRETSKEKSSVESFDIRSTSEPATPLYDRSVTHIQYDRSSIDHADHRNTISSRADSVFGVRSGHLGSLNDCSRKDKNAKSYFKSHVDQSFLFNLSKNELMTTQMEPSHSSVITPDPLSISSSEIYSCMISCSLCPYRAHRQDTLDVHMRKHSQKKLYSCPLCDKCFGKPCQLEVHARTHTGDKPFACDLCPYKSSQKSNLKFHLLRCHSKFCRFLCKFCLFRFDNELDLDGHILAKHQL